MIDSTTFDHTKGKSPKILTVILVVRDYIR